MAVIIKTGELYYQALRPSGGKKRFKWSSDRGAAYAWEMDLVAVSAAAQLSRDNGPMDVIDAGDGHLVAHCEDGRRTR